MPHYTSNLGVLHSGNKIHKPELVKKIGGTHVLKQAVNNFYDRLTVDPAIRIFFEGADLQVLRWHQFNSKFSDFRRSVNASNNMDEKKTVLWSISILCDAMYKC